MDHLSVFKWEIVGIQRNLFIFRVGVRDARGSAGIYEVARPDRRGGRDRKATSHFGKGIGKKDKAAGI